MHIHIHFAHEDKKSHKRDKVHVEAMMITMMMMMNWWWCMYVRVFVEQPTTSRSRGNRQQAATTPTTAHRSTGTGLRSAARRVCTPCSRKFEQATASYPPNFASTKPASKYKPTGNWTVTNGMLNFIQWTTSSEIRCTRYKPDCLPKLT